MNSKADGMGILWFAYLSLLGLGLLLSGLLIPSVDPAYVYAGGLVLALAFLVVFVVLGLWRLRVFWFFVLAWLVGVITQGFLFYNMGLFLCICMVFGLNSPWTMFESAMRFLFMSGEFLLIMCSTVMIHGPLLLLTCRLYEKYGRRLRFRIWLLFVAAFFLAMFLPFFTCVLLQKEYSKMPEEVRVSSDRLQDKQPAFVDNASMWHENRLTDAVRQRVNKSSAVVGLDVAGYTDTEKHLGEKLFRSYKDALDYARDYKLSIIPSFQMVDHRSKQFADKLYAAVELFMEEDELSPGGGKTRFLSDLLQQLLSGNGGSQASTEAAAYIAAGLSLGGKPIPKLPDAVDSLRLSLQKGFLASPLNAKPVSFYAEDERLTLIFVQDRFFQTKLRPEVAVVLARLLNKNTELKRSYISILALNSRITNPPSRFSVADVCEYSQFFDAPGRLVEELLKSEKGKGFIAFAPEEQDILFLPQAMAKENVLFSKLYGSLGALPQENLMNVLIEHIRSGRIDLMPTPGSGWYDHQTYALETLLLPEKAEEAQKLYLTADYKKLHVEAFKTVMTKNRELHSKLLREVFSLGSVAEPTYTFIHPELRVEPTPTCYLRTAQAYAFVFRELRKMLGDDQVRRIAVDGTPLADAEKQMILLLAGMYLVSSDDIGMAPARLADVITAEDAPTAMAVATQFLNDVGQDGVYSSDVRFIIPIMQEPQGKKARYWMTCGVKLTKIRSEYLRPPVIQLVPEKAGEQMITLSATNASVAVAGEHFNCKFVPAEFYMPVEVFTEADSSKKPLTRKEFRKLCDGCQSVTEIEQAMQARLNPLRMGRTGTAMVIALVLLGLAAGFLPLLRKSRLLSGWNRKTVIHCVLFGLVTVGAYKLVVTRERGQALLSAVVQGRVDVAKSLLEKGVSPNVRTADGNRHAALELACERGNLQLVALLLAHGADANSDGRVGRSLLSIAAVKGNAALFQLLLDHGVPWPQTNDTSRAEALGHTQEELLMHAAGGGSVDIVKAILERGIEVNTRTSNDRTALAEAVEDGREDMVRFLLSRGAQVESARSEGYASPLVKACWHKQLGIARILVDHGASIGPAHLSAAAYGGSIEIMKLFLEKGPTGAANKNGWSDEAYVAALEEACSQKNVRMVSFLIHAGAKCDSPAPLLRAASQTSVEVMSLLLDNGANVNQAGRYGETAIMNAIDMTSPADAVAFLIQKGADVNAVGESPKRSVFEKACAYERYDIAALLLKHGAKGRMPERKAAFHGYRRPWYESSPLTLLLCISPFAVIWIILFAVSKPRRTD